LQRSRFWVVSTAMAGTGRDGDWWTHLPVAIKLTYMHGFLNGQTFSHQAFDRDIYTALLDPKTGRYDAKLNPGMITLQTAVHEEFKAGLNGVSPGQLIEGLYKLYGDYRNKRLEVADALDVVVRSISGSNDSQYESLLERYCPLPRDQCSVPPLRLPGSAERVARQRLHET
jgi:hypothetical protein